MMIGGLSNYLLNYLKNFVQTHSQLITTIKLEELILGQKRSWQLLNENIIGQECIKKFMITYNHVTGVKESKSTNIMVLRLCLQMVHLNDGTLIFFKLSKTTEGYQYLLLVVDSFTSWLKLFLLKIKKAERLPKYCLNNFFKIWSATKTSV